MRTSLAIASLTVLLPVSFAQNVPTCVTDCLTASAPAAGCDRLVSFPGSTAN